MIGYKAAYRVNETEFRSAFSRFTYKVGESYEIYGIPVFCYQGFHYCTHPVNTLMYYDFSKDFSLFEIEDLGTRLVSLDKNVTNKLKINRLIDSVDEIIDLIGFHISYDEYDYIKEIKTKNKIYIFKQQSEFTASSFMNFLYGTGYFYFSKKDKGYQIFDEDWFYLSLKSSIEQIIERVKNV
jgi:hypothetical protein